MAQSLTRLTAPHASKRQHAVEQLAVRHLAGRAQRLYVNGASRGARTVPNAAQRTGQWRAWCVALHLAVQTLATCVAHGRRRQCTT